MIDKGRMAIKKTTLYIIGTFGVLVSILVSDMLLGVTGLLPTSLSAGSLFSASVPKFSESAAGVERKKLFIEYFLPIIQRSNEEILEDRKILLKWKNDITTFYWWDDFLLGDIIEKYRMPDFNIEADQDWEQLLTRVNEVPVSLALAQAANESAWGTSRFAQEGNNYYGQWCFVKGCGLVPKGRGGSKVHEVAVFNTPSGSVESYLTNLNSHNAYNNLRKIRTELQAKNEPVTGLLLAEGLGQYSERGDVYIKDLQSLIRFNELTQYDMTE